jgi:lysozyme family protein
MANVDEAIKATLLQEDASMTGKVTTLTGDSGGATRFGLASKSHPELVRAGYFSAKVNKDMALSVAEQVYMRSYAAPLHIEDINDQSIANLLLSMGINCGAGEAAKLIQKACKTLGRNVKVDDEMGTETVSAINSLVARSILDEFAGECRTFYFDLVAKEPSQGVFLEGWLNRVAAASKAA